MGLLVCLLALVVAQVWQLHNYSTTVKLIPVFLFVVFTILFIRLFVVVVRVGLNGEARLGRQMHVSLCFCIG